MKQNSPKNDEESKKANHLSKLSDYLCYFVVWHRLVFSSVITGHDYCDTTKSSYWSFGFEEQFYVFGHVTNATDQSPSWSMIKLGQAPPALVPDNSCPLCLCCCAKFVLVFAQVSKCKYGHWPRRVSRHSQTRKSIARAK